MVPRQQTGQQCIARHDGNVVCYSVSIAPTLSPDLVVSTGVCCAVAFRADVGGGAVERHTQPVPQAAADSPGRVDGDPDQQMEPSLARPAYLQAPAAA